MCLLLRCSNEPQQYQCCPIFVWFVNCKLRWYWEMHCHHWQCHCQCQCYQVSRPTLSSPAGPGCGSQSRMGCIGEWGHRRPDHLSMRRTCPGSWHLGILTIGSDTNIADPTLHSSLFTQHLVTTWKYNSVHWPPQYIWNILFTSWPWYQPRPEHCTTDTGALLDIWDWSGSNKAPVGHWG